MSQPPSKTKTITLESPPKDTITMDLKPQEAGLIALLRSLKFGVIEKIGVQDGLPTVINGIINQRTDLTKQDELARLLKLLG